jgi:16S rRNA (cytosine1402-N4)-methyltransferase
MMSNNTPESNDKNLPGEHIPVLAQTLTNLISLPKDAAVVDATVGHGGHSYLFGKKLGPDAIILGFDVDRNSLDRALFYLKDLDCKVVLIRKNFAKIAETVKEQQLGKLDFVLADLGFCSAQVDNVSKGLSFRENMPLDMRLDEDLKVSAAQIVNTEDEESLANLIFKYGQERASRRIARFIVEYRSQQRIMTTAQLAAIVCKALRQPIRGKRAKRIHPATKTFQALRIAVNDELGSLKTLLQDAAGLLKKDGKIAVISFHSLEDKLVKENFKKNAADGLYEIMTKKPITPSKEEINENPRARSAKLRIAKRI